MIKSANELMFLLMRNSIIFEHICTFNKGLNKNTYYLTARNKSTYILIEKYQDDKDLLVEQYYDDILQNIESISNKLFISYPLTLDTLKQIDLLINPNTDVENVIYVDLDGYDWKDSTEKWGTVLETIKDTPMEEHILPSDDEMKLNTNVMEKLFKAYSHFDFVDVCDMVNYRGGICLETHLERQNIEPRHLQLYVKELCDKCYEKWLNEHNDTSYMENDIYISIAKNGECQISYIPMMASSK